MIIAYLDPSTGGLVIQTIVAAAVAIPIVLRSQIARGIALIRSHKGEQESVGTDQSGD